MSLEISFQSDIGRARSNNEDSYLVIPPWSDPALTLSACFFAVADGMGGHCGGEIASQLAMRTLKNWFERKRIFEFSVGLIENAFAEANQAIYDFAKMHPELEGMGTTLTSVLLTGNQAIMGHVGDTRIYRLRGREFKQLSNDHTLIADQIKSGRITPEAAKTHPARHILSRALGVREFIQVETTQFEVFPEDIFFLCSDGVTGHMHDDQIKTRLGTRPFRNIAREIIADANANGGKDNITAVAFRVTDVPIEFPGRYSFQRLMSFISHFGEKFCC